MRSGWSWWRGSPRAGHPPPRWLAADCSVEVVNLYHADQAVILETILAGTQMGPFAGLAPTGRSMSGPLFCIFDFDEDKMIGEKVYFDLATVVRKLQA